MAKKAAQMRVHQIAKELGVTSKDVVAKCRAEDIPGITNHMSTVSLGLAATIREWFGDGGDGGTVTAVQTAAPVDVAQAKAKRKARPKAARKTTRADEPEIKAAEETQPRAEAKAPEAGDAAPAETQPEAQPKDEATQPAVQAEPAPTAEAPAEAEQQPAPAEERPAAAAEAPSEAQGAAPSEAATAEAAEEQAQAAAPGKAEMNVPQRPEVIKPAGPMLQQPSATKLSGPKVVRVESPEVLPPPRPRGPRPDAPGRGGRGPGGPGRDTGAPGRPGRGGAGAGAGGGGASRRNKRRSGGGDGRSGRSTLGGTDRSFNWREQDLREREARLNRAGGFFKAARRDNLKRSAGGGFRATSAAKAGGTVRVEEPITVKSLSAATGVKAAEILRKAFLLGQPVTINSGIGTDLAQAIMADYDIELDVVEHRSAEDQIVEQFKEREMVDEQPRSPVVTILGHVDHGKTSLLDRIRQTNVAEGEAGGITQATSAFRVPVTVSDQDHTITFIDTPGHEAFTEMRARGAKVTDVVVLVVAADDGVMPQTLESINHAKAAGVPIIVALNKVDKPEATDANIQRILGQLAEHDLNPVDWGGSTEIIRTSAIKGEGIQELLEILDYQAQLLELKADFGGNAEGTVLEARLEEGRGPVASIIIQQGRLNKGDFIVVGRAYGRVRDIVNDRGQRVDEAAPGMPVAISGLSEVPDAGDKFYIVDSLKAAEAAAAERREQERQRELATEKVTLDNIFDKLAASERKELPLVIKADVQGSVDTVRASLQKLSGKDVTIGIKHAAVGGVNDSDVTLAEASGAIIIGFNVTASGKARKLAESRGVDIRFYDVIYDLIDDVTRAAEGLLEPEVKLEVLGHAEVREVFKVSKVGMVAGCYVTDGAIERNAQIRVTRSDIVVEKDRRLDQLKRFKDDVKEVRAGQECGMKIEGYNDIKVGDVLECYKTREVRRTLAAAGAEA